MYPHISGFILHVFILQVVMMNGADSSNKRYIFHCMGWGAGCQKNGQVHPSVSSNSGGQRGSYSGGQDSARHETIKEPTHFSITSGSSSWRPIGKRPFSSVKQVPVYHPWQLIRYPSYLLGTTGGRDIFGSINKHLHTSPEHQRSYPFASNNPQYFDFQVSDRTYKPKWYLPNPKPTYHNTIPTDKIETWGFPSSRQQRRVYNSHKRKRNNNFVSTKAGAW
ncbi:uncharacterized protein LOC106161628 [Lingula anatina]|uniref:Uncharacterized protein LOC106161628 n=1 Tax=Lingula anatina TaxID=7574 RepID=A0A1S3I9N0_LINAN|nr:uncharacterized protein LOC106161628 [Lingula anatina]|eukprot:XP_013394104.1 uncharacterized protein LOC106161628 [Lingula anatina]